MTIKYFKYQLKAIDCSCSDSLFIWLPLNSVFGERIDRWTTSLCCHCEGYISLYIGKLAFCLCVSVSLGLEIVSLLLRDHWFSMYVAFINVLSMWKSFSGECGQWGNTYSFYFGEHTNHFLLDTSWRWEFIPFIAALVYSLVL